MVSLHKLLHKLKLFGSCSGLKPNTAKTEVLRLGPSQKDVDIYSILKIPKPSEPPKILGVYFTYDNRLRDRLNFENLIKSVKKLLAQWRRRNLTILGKIQVIKSHTQLFSSYIKRSRPPYFADFAEIWLAILF